MTADRQKVSRITPDRKGYFEHLTKVTFGSTKIDILDGSPVVNFGSYTYFCADHDLKSVPGFGRNTRSFSIHRGKFKFQTDYKIEDQGEGELGAWWDFRMDEDFRCGMLTANTISRL